mmetsp:Transcript_18644/g.21415  ORF Transcript_18644/g.21415 Transcript_18644/m.21415 type:complete len:230 (+) Transcript_18644:2-691(+)
MQQSLSYFKDCYIRASDENCGAMSGFGNILELNFDQDFDLWSPDEPRETSFFQDKREELFLECYGSSSSTNSYKHNDHAKDAPVYSKEQAEHFEFAENDKVNGNLSIDEPEVFLNNANDLIQKKENEEKVLNDQLSIIFKPKEEKQTELSMRRDVVTKAIFRGFKKYYSKLFKFPFGKASKMTQESTSLMLKHIYEKSIELGIVSITSASVDIALLELMGWMSMIKNTK